MIEGVDDVVASAGVFVAHGFDGGAAIFEGFDGGVLGHGIGAEDGILMNFHHGIGEDGWGAGVADAEAGHGEGFRETVEEDAAVAHPWEGGDADVFGVIVSEFAIDFVGEDDEIVSDAELGNFF